MQLFWHTSFWPLLTLDRMPSLDHHRDGPAAWLDKYVNVMCVCVSACGLHSKGYHSMSENILSDITKG